MLYALAIVGLVPSPAFPFDPGLYGLGARGAIAFGLIALAAAASLVLARARGAAGGAPPAAAPALGMIAAGACALLWLANPYLALLLAPTAHVWLLAAGARRRLALIAIATVAACGPVLAATVAIAGVLDLGADAPWTLALMVADGQIGLGVTVPLCFVAGALVGGLSMIGRRRPIPAAD